MSTRRQFLAAGGGVIAALATPLRLSAMSAEIIEMRGTPRGERIWFDPLGLAVAPGTTLRFLNRDPGNSHTATTYHPDLFGRVRRIPESARPWDSGFLLPDDSFEVTLTVPGVYDIYCLPHEMAGMVGRIVVGAPSDAGWTGAVEDPGKIPQAALATFPAVDAILSRGRIDPGEPA